MYIKIPKNVKFIIPSEKYEYNYHKQLVAVTDYGDYIRAARNDPRFDQMSNDDIKQFIINYIVEKHENETFQACNFTDNGKECIEIHIIMRKTGYILQAYFGEGKRKTLGEKIDLDYEWIKSEYPEIAEEIHKAFSNENLIKILVGRKGIKTVRPKCEDWKAKSWGEIGKEIGIDYFIWRMTRFNLGIDTNMPVTCEMELDSWIEKFGIKKYDKDYKRIPDYKRIYNLISNLVDFMNAKSFGDRSNLGAMTWARALGVPV